MMIDYYNHTVVVFLLLSLGIFELGSCTENPSQTNNNVTVKCIQSEREALVSFRAGVNNIPGKLSSWVGEDCCQWNGVECDDESGHVTKLNLRNPAGCHSHFDYIQRDSQYANRPCEACVVVGRAHRRSLLGKIISPLIYSVVALQIFLDDH